MMATDDDADVFEITDFTTASEWERFIARFEEILHEWKLPNRPPLPPAKKDEYANGVWAEKKDDIEFAGFKFDVVYTYLKSNVQQRAPSDEKERPEEENDNDEDENDNRNATVFTDLMNMGNDFPSRAHCLCRWYGLQEFLVIAPTQQQSECLETESRINILLSSVSIALSNTSCPVPTFVQVLQKWRKVYTGVSIVPGAKVEFEMSHLRSIPSQYTHLSGLLSVFKSKLNCTYLTLPAVNVAVRFTYVLTDWIHNPWPQEPPDFGSVMEGEVGCGDFKTLPFGACVDPVSELHLSCTWPCLSEDMIVEDHVYSDLDPMQAPQWSVRIQMADNPQCLLGDYLRHFLELSSRPETTDELLGGLGLEEEGGERGQGADISHALQRLTEPNVPYSIPSLSSVVNHASARIRLRPDEAPIPTELLNSVLLYLFPDARGVVTNEEVQETDAEKEEEDPEKSEILNELKKQLKSAPLDSLTYKLAVVLSVLSHEDKGLRRVAHLWQELVLEMRYRWEHKVFIPGVETCQPNMGACLLHQKLQMLNCCIERKIKRESLGYGFGPESAQNSPTGEVSEGRPASPTEKPESPRRRAQSSTISDEADSGNAGPVEAWLNTPDNIGSSSEDEEFFECNEEEEAEMESAAGDSKLESSNEEKSDEKSDDKLDGSMHRSSMSSEASFKEALTNRPEGRLAPFKDMKLSKTGEQLYIPITQEPSPMTEDMIEEHAEVLAKLGSTAEGSQLRARMQSACLLSDMESFKAANPGATLEDFVKWYSPRDWVEEEVMGEGGVVERKGSLSQRMQIPGNMWVEVWQNARAVPARRQKRLFDDTKEAEKVLHFLASLKPGDVVLHLLPMLIHAGIARVVQELDKELPSVKTLLEQVVTRAIKASRQPDPRRFEEAVRMLELAETVIARGQSLRAKFTSDLLDKPAAAEELQVFVRTLMQCPEVAVRGGPCGPAGAIIHKLFVAAQRAQHMVSDEESESDSGTPVHRSSALESHRPSSTVPDFPKPYAREYILRAMVPRPAPYSRVLPQKMFCVLMEKDYRLAGAFCSDTTFQ